MSILSYHVPKGFKVLWKLFSLDLQERIFLSVILAVIVLKLCTCFSQMRQN